MRAWRVLSLLLVVLAGCALTSCETGHGLTEPPQQSLEPPRLLKSAKATLAFQNMIVVVSLSDLEDGAGDTTEISSQLLVWSSNKENSKDKRAVVSLSYVGDLLPKRSLFEYPANYKRDEKEERWNFCLRLHYKQKEECLYGYVLTDKTKPEQPLIAAALLTPEADCAGCETAP